MKISLNGVNNWLEMKKNISDHKVKDIETIQSENIEGKWGFRDLRDNIRNL